MASTTQIQLETHPDGTVGVAGIINSNWSRLDAVFDPALSSSDNAFQAFGKALIRGALPTTNGASIQWRETTTPKKFLHRPGTAAVASGTAPVLDFEGAMMQVVTLTGAGSFTTSNRNPGWKLEALVTGGASSRALTFPGWVFVGAAAPATLAASKAAILELWCNGTTEGSILARWTVQP